jgi:hypothetical protein
MNLSLINSTLIPKKSFSRPSTGKIIPNASLGQKQNPSNQLGPQTKPERSSVLEELYNRPKPKHKAFIEVKGWFGGSTKPLANNSKPTDTKPTNKKSTTNKPLNLKNLIKELPNYGSLEYDQRKKISTVFEKKFGHGKITRESAKKFGGELLKNKELNPTSPDKNAIRNIFGIKK